MFSHFVDMNELFYTKGIIALHRLYKALVRGYIKQIDSYKTFKKELKSLLLLHSFYSVEQFIAL